MRKDDSLMFFDLFKNIYRAEVNKNAVGFFQHLHIRQQNCIRDK